MPGTTTKSQARNRLPLAERHRWLLLLLVIALAACRMEQADKPLPQPLTMEALGHYCQMEILQHEGPKAQIYLAGLAEPIWFAQVRDALAYTRLAERSHQVVAVYVNDMGQASSWAEPGADNWVDAEVATFVVGSDAVGGMGAPEVVPFGEATVASTFQVKRGGMVVGYQDIPDDAVLGEVEINLPSTYGE